jgi:hypothetical protein
VSRDTRQLGAGPTMIADAGSIRRVNVPPTRGIAGRRVRTPDAHAVRRSTVQRGSRRGGRSRSPSPAVRPPSRPPAAAAIKVGG